MQKSIRDLIKPRRSAVAVVLASTFAVAPGCGGGDADSGSGAGNAEQANHKPSTPQNYTLFEAGAVRPVAVLPDGLVAVTNIPDDRVEFFRPHGHGVKHCGS